MCSINRLIKVQGYDEDEYLIQNYEFHGRFILT